MSTQTTPRERATQRLSIVVEGLHPDGRWDSDLPPPIGWDIPMRYRLDGRELHPGQSIAVELESGSWLRGRYCEPTSTSFAFNLALQLAGQDEEEFLSVPTEASFRWPLEPAA